MKFRPKLLQNNQRNWTSEQHNIVHIIDHGVCIHIHVYLVLWEKIWTQLWKRPASNPFLITAHDCEQKRHCWCSIGTCAALQLHKPHLQSWQKTVHKLLGVLPKKFSSAVILFNVEFEFCIAVLVIFLSTRLSVACGWLDRGLCMNDSVSMYIVSKCDSL